MDIQQVMARVSELEQAFAPAVSAPPPTATASFQSQLDAASLALQGQGPSSGLAVLQAALAQPAPTAGYGALSPLGTLQPAGMPSSTGTPATVLSDAEREVGQQETSANDGQAIARYRSAVAGAQPGDAWCAEFVSYVAAEAGEPLGSNGAGFRSVADLTNWASQSGRLLPATATPQAGDLILFGTEHVGVVERVNADGSIDTVEGNYANQVSRVHRQRGEWTGFVGL